MKMTGNRPRYARSLIPICFCTHSLFTHHSLTHSLTHIMYVIITNSPTTTLSKLTSPSTTNSMRRHCHHLTKPWLSPLTRSLTHHTCKYKYSTTTPTYTSSPAIAEAHMNKQQERDWLRIPSSTALLKKLLTHSPTHTVSSDAVTTPTILKDWTSYFHVRYPDCASNITNDAVAMRVLTNISTFPLSLSYGLSKVFPVTVPKDEIKVCGENITCVCMWLCMWIYNISCI